MEKLTNQGVCSKCGKPEIYIPMKIYCMECSKGFFSKNEKTYRNKKWHWLRSLKEDKPCTDCGISYPYYVMHWDHLRDKEFTIGTAIRLGYQRILKEIEKCELVCGNCHAERTHQRKHTNA